MKSVSRRFSKRLVRHAAHGRHLPESHVEVVEDGREEGVGGLVHRPLHLSNAVIAKLALSVVKNNTGFFRRENSDKQVRKEQPVILFAYSNF